MAIANVCDPSFGDFLMGTIVPLSAVCAVAASAVIGFAYMIGSSMANPKLTLWAKTEAIQILISLSSILILIPALGAFCSINATDINEAVGSPSGTTVVSANVFESAAAYANNAASYSHKALTVIRYHLEAYSILSQMNKFECDTLSFGSIGCYLGFCLDLPLGCLFGESGVGVSPYAGGAKQAALNAFFNTTLISYFSALNFLFILLFTYKGFVLVFLPIGLVLRSVPYLRQFGAVLIAVALSFFFVYPLFLAVFNLISADLLKIPDFFADKPYFFREDAISASAAGGLGQSIGAALLNGDQFIFNQYFPDGENTEAAIDFGARAFVAGVFFPTIALLGTIASTAYIARLYGEEIDLSRLTQLV